ncbi:MAG TPA: hypothetical protein VFW56_04065 [Bradyrhizobium sp.]|nr:hypothetical protein [Bradyrhizobium sp.]
MPKATKGISNIEQLKRRADRFQTLADRAYGDRTATILQAVVDELRREIMELEAIIGRGKRA